jgi:hypothetical protein
MASDAAAYLTSHGYAAPTIAVSDPNWMKLSQAVNHMGNNVLPFFVVVDGDMNIAYVGDGGSTQSTPYAAIQNQLQTLTGVAFNPGSECGASAVGTCEGSCGGQATSCWCDNLCAQYGDCCPDICDFCAADAAEGFCP